MSASSLPSSTCVIGENTSQLKADGSSGSKYSLHTVATNSVEIVFSGCLPHRIPSAQAPKDGYECGSAIGGRARRAGDGHPVGLSSSAQRRATPNAAPSLRDRAHLALGPDFVGIGRVAQGRQALHDSTASPSIQIRLGIRDRI